MKEYTVYYTKTTQGQVEIKASSPEEAQYKFESGNYSKGGEREYDEPVDVYSVSRNM
jgi:hypothetical protein